MGLFKKKLSLNDILEGINNLSDEDKSKVKELFEEVKQPEEKTEEVTAVESNDSTTVDETVEEVNNDTEEKVDEVGESEVVEENNEGEEAIETAPVEEQPVKPITEESTTEETEVVEEQPENLVEEVAPEVQKQNEELDNSQSAKIQALEEKVALLEEKLEQALASLDNKDFGLNPALPEGGGKDHERMSAVMRGYAGGNANKYF